jgi:alpha-galactosidase
LSQYLPNNLISVPLNRLDDYSFHSALAASLIPGWIADAPDFDSARARELLKRYQSVRHLLVGAWYPLLPYSRRAQDWIAVQFHRPDLDEGVILCFRHAGSPYRTAEVTLRGLDAKTVYRVVSDSTGAVQSAPGGQLMGGWSLTLPEKGRSDLIVYQRERVPEKR